MNDVLDQTETLLAYLLCADDSSSVHISPAKKHIKLHQEQDATSLIKFEPLYPSCSYTVQMDEEKENDRIYTADPSLLMNSVQDLIGKHKEVALLSEGKVQWFAYRKIHKAPKNVFISSPGASLYEFHYREAYSNGKSIYYRRIAAISKTGKPVPTILVGSAGSNSDISGKQVVIAASIVEDAHRSDVFTASIKESTEILLPVPIGEHKELFALRDGPMTNAGKRKAIMHWVAKHMRETSKGNTCVVGKHLRGVNTFDIDGLTVTLTANKS